MINKPEYNYLCAWCDGHTPTLHEIIHHGSKVKKEEMRGYFLDILGLNYHSIMLAYQIGGDRYWLEESTEHRTETIKRFMI